MLYSGSIVHVENSITGSSGQGEIPDRRYSPRARERRCFGTGLGEIPRPTVKVWMEEDGCKFKDEFQFSGTVALFPRKSDIEIFDLTCEEKLL